MKLYLVACRVRILRCQGSRPRPKAQRRGHWFYADRSTLRSSYDGLPSRCEHTSLQRSCCYLASITSLSWRHRAGGQSQGHVIVSPPARHAPCTTDALFAILLTATSLRQQLSVCPLENTQFSVGIFRRPFLKRYHRSLILWSPPAAYEVRPSRPLLEIRDQLRTSLWGDADARWLPSNFFPTGQIGRFPKTCVVSVAINTGRSVCDLGS